MISEIEKKINERIKTQLRYNDNKVNQKCEFFRNICLKKINKEDNIKESYEHEKFIDIVDKLNCKFPFLKINEFINDYVKGVHIKEFIPKYNFTQKSDFYYCLSKSLLNLPRQRTKTLNDKSDYAKRENLKLTQISTVYNFILKESKYFLEELNYLFQFNKAMEIVILKNLNNKSRFEEIIENEIIYNEDNKKIFEIKISSELKDLIKEKFKEICVELYKKNIFEYTIEKEYHINYNYNSIETIIKKILEKHKDGITYEKIIDNLTKDLRFILQINSFTLINNILEKLVDIGIVKFEKGFGESHILETKFFTTHNYQNQEEVNIPINSEFFGRRNDPFEFVSAIKDLDKGDFSDEDDQVTRIAGLILAGTQKMTAEKCASNEFDFAVSMEGFNPTKEQIELMKENNFEIFTSTRIIQMYVGINEEITFEKFQKMKSSLRDDEQAVIITLKDLDEECYKEIEKNKKIQVIHKKLLFKWAETIPKLPSRKGSVVKIMQGQNLGNIGKLISINYVTGKSEIETIKSDHITDSIRNLEEIDLIVEDSEKKFLVMHYNYFQFLKKIRENSISIEFDKAMFYQNQLDDEFNPSNRFWEIELEQIFRCTNEKYDFSISFKEKKFKNIFLCNCDAFKNEKKLCFHLVSTLNEIGIRNDSFGETWGEETNLLYSIINKV